MVPGYLRLCSFEARNSLVRLEPTRNGSIIRTDLELILTWNDA